MVTPFETWRIDKPAVRGARGVVAAQNIEAAEIGAQFIDDGGNAIDAAVATALALAVCEPWMSGLGGGGFMVIYSAAEERVRVIDFAMKSSRHLDPSAYPLAGGTGADLFGWPAVVEDRNVHGPLSIAVPGSVAGYAHAAARFGSRPFAELARPAAALAARGHRLTWWTTLNVAADAGLLAGYDASRQVWLAKGMPDSVDIAAEPSFLPLGGLADTFDRLVSAGPEDFYHGDLARALVADLGAAGSPIDAEDLAGYAVAEVDPLALAGPDGARYCVPPGMTAGPTFADTLSQLTRSPDGGPPKPEDLADWARAMIAAYQYRLTHLGHSGDVGDRACTTHLSAADSAGNMVAMTTTLLSRFGSRVVLPGTGVLMNNGVNWFDPRPGQPNSLAAGVRPLSNMVPLLALKDARPWFAVGASGGRRIMPCVFQIAQLIAGHGLDLDAAMAYPRFDMSELNHITVDDRLPAGARAALAGVAPIKEVQTVAFPSRFACPQAVMRVEDGVIGAAHMDSPLNGAAAV
ncbi:MAG: gamma-glutamyltransferase [Thalassobaculaceae bacterium]